MTVEQERLPRRDWFILPLLSLLSLGLVLGLSEAGARIVWPEHLEDRCAVPDPILGLHFQPNCTAEVKSPETPWLDNTYNALWLSYRRTVRSQAGSTVFAWR